MPRHTADLFERRRRVEADLRPARYVKPVGRGFHVVRLQDGTEYVAGAGQGSATYAPGQVVAIGTYSGSRDRVIATGPAPGRRGGSLAPNTYAEETYRAAPDIQGVYPRTFEVGIETPGYIWGYRLDGRDFYYYTHDETEAEVVDERARVFGELWIPSLGFQPDGPITVDADSLQTPAATWAGFGVVSSDDIVIDEVDGAGDALGENAAYLAVVWIDVEAESVELSKGPQVADGIAPPSPQIPAGEAAIPWASVIRRVGDLDAGGSQVAEVPAYNVVRSITEALGGQEHAFAWFVGIEGLIDQETHVHLRA